VSDYVDCFAELVDQLTAFGHITEPVYYAMRFVDGLREDIRVAISLHRPFDFDIDASLALLQEDISSGFKSKRSDSSYSSKPVSRLPLPLPPPPSTGKAFSPVSTEEVKLSEGQIPADHMAALRAFRKSKGLCMRCAEKWHKSHRCGDSV
jgi:hypothetical protein